MKRRKDRKEKRKIFKSLYFKFVAFFSVIILVAGVSIGLAYRRSTIEYLTNAKRADMEKAVDAISYLMKKYAKSEEYNTSEKKEKSSQPESDYYILRSRMAACYEILDADIYITDRQGNIVMSFPIFNEEEDFITRDAVYFPQEFESKFLHNEESGYSFINPKQYNECFKNDDFVVDYDDFYGFYTEEEGSHLTISKRIVLLQGANAEVFGSVIMSFAMPELAAAQKTITSFIFFITMCAIIMEVLAILILTGYITKPIRMLIEGTEQMAKGKFDIHIERTTNDEVGDLVDAFNKAAESLNNLDTVRNDFIANVSHELRTPMTSMKGFVEAILDGVIPPEKEREYLKKVHREITRMNTLINDLLDWARLSAGKGNFQMAVFDINKIITMVVANLEPLILQKNIEMVTDFQNSKQNVYGDSNSIERVFINLINNAIKFTPEEGRITISVTDIGDRVQIKVADSGIGMTDEEMAFIFERFYKVDKSRSSEKKSTGLGLPIVQKILQNHHQDITVKSKKGEGSCFTFTLDKEAPNEEG